MPKDQLPDSNKRVLNEHKKNIHISFLFLLLDVIVLICKQFYYNNLVLFQNHVGSGLKKYLNKKKFIFSKI